MFEDKVVAITGGTDGIGKALVAIFLKENEPIFFKKGNLLEKM